MSSAAAAPLTIERVGVTDRLLALELVFAHLPVENRAWRVAQVLRDSRSGQAYELWIGRRGTRLVAATLSHHQPGGTAMVWTARSVADEPRATSLALMRRLMGDLESRNLSWAQALVERDGDDVVGLLESCDFRQLAHLLCMVSLVGQSFGKPAVDGPLSYEPFETSGGQERLAEIVEQTYQGSLDCPEVDRWRDAREALDGYRSAAGFDAARWLTVRCEGHDAGCLLLTPQEPQQWELTYMGVLPEFRGRGMGLAMVRHAQWLAGGEGCERLVLAVDAANTPAIDVYEAAGFITWDRRRVFVRRF